MVLMWTFFAKSKAKLKVRNYYPQHLLRDHVRWASSHLGRKDIKKQKHTLG
jgi:hypothetical protein